MAGLDGWAVADVVGLLLVGGQDVPAVALRGAGLLPGAAVLPAAVYALRAGRPARPVRLPRLDAGAGRSGVQLPLSAHVISLRPWCSSYQRRSSGTQRARARRPTASTTAAVRIGPRLHSRLVPRAAAA